MKSFKRIFPSVLLVRLSHAKLPHFLLVEIPMMLCWGVWNERVQSREESKSLVFVLGPLQAFLHKT